MNVFSQDAERVVSSGDKLTIETIAGFIELVRHELMEATTVVIEFKPDVEMDITALQVFCSACKMAEAQGKKLLHRGSPPQALLELTAAAGPVRHGLCSRDSESCFRRFGGVKEWEK